MHALGVMLARTPVGECHGVRVGCSLFIHYGLSATVATRARNATVDVASLLLAVFHRLMSRANKVFSTERHETVCGNSTEIYCGL